MEDEAIIVEAVRRGRFNRCFINTFFLFFLLLLVACRARCAMGWNLELH
jgi:hypothetical protein